MRAKTGNQTWSSSPQQRRFQRVSVIAVAFVCFICFALVCAGQTVHTPTATEEKNP
jgi:hypothetical protein